MNSFLNIFKNKKVEEKSDSTLEVNTVKEISSSTSKRDRDLDEYASDGESNLSRCSDQTTTDIEPPRPSTLQNRSSFKAPVILPLQDRHALEFWSIILGGVALAFNSGLLNGTTLLLQGIAVTHVTGSTSNAGIRFVNDKRNDEMLFPIIILSFLVGAIITGAVSPSSSFKLGAQYGPLFIIGSALLIGASLFEVYYPNSNGDLYFAAMASGLQNAITTKYSSSVIRTTHVTGTVTDIGIVIGRMLRGDNREKWKLNVLVPIYIGFLLGGICSWPCVKTLGTKAISVNVVIFLAIGTVYTLIIVSKLQVPLWRVMFGMYTFAEKKAKKAKKKISKISHSLRESLDNPLRSPVEAISHSLRRSRESTVSGVVGEDNRSRSNSHSSSGSHSHIHSNTMQIYASRGNSTNDFKSQHTPIKSTRSADSSVASTASQSNDSTPDDITTRPPGQGHIKQDNEGQHIIATRLPGQGHIKQDNEGQYIIDMRSPMHESISQKNNTTNNIRPAYYTPSEAVSIKMLEQDDDDDNDESAALDHLPSYPSKSNHSHSSH